MWADQPGFCRYFIEGAPHRADLPVNADIIWMTLCKHDIHVIAAAYGAGGGTCKTGRSCWAPHSLPARPS